MKVDTLVAAYTPDIVSKIPPLTGKAADHSQPVVETDSRMFGSSLQAEEELAQCPSKYSGSCFQIKVTSPQVCLCFVAAAILTQVQFVLH